MEALSLRNFRTLDDVDVRDKTVLVRVDINSPINPSTGEIMSDFRIKAILDTLEELNESKVVLLSHQGRPCKDDFTSLSKHASVLQSYLGERLRFVPDVMGPTAINEIRNLKRGDILLLDNVRLMAEEVAEASPQTLANSLFVETLSKHLDLFVNDAFPCIHRSNASMVGFPKHLPTAIGRLMEKELDAVNKVLGHEMRKRVFLIGGAKPKDRVRVIKHILEAGVGECTFLLGGVIAKVFLVAANVKIPESIRREITTYVDDLDIEEVRSLLGRYGEDIILPIDYAYEFHEVRIEDPIQYVDSGETVYDIGSRTIKAYSRRMREADLIFANGPLGYMEDPLFIRGTIETLKAIIDLKGYKIVGGGHLSTLVEEEGISDRFDHVSTGGGSLLHLLSGEIPLSLKLLMK